LLCFVRVPSQSCVVTPFSKSLVFRITLVEKITTLTTLTVQEKGQGLNKLRPLA
jgi:hypothetical protein